MQQRVEADTTCFHLPFSDAPQSIWTAPTQRCRMFCIPQAGMGAWVYHAWAKPDMLGNWVQVVPVELPGHNSRHKELPETDLLQLAASLASQIAAVVLADGPDVAYFIWGHSMGAWIAYEVVQELMRRGCRLPSVLFVASNRAPHLAGMQHDVDPVQLSRLPQDRFFEAMERRYGPNPSLAHPGIQSKLYPVLRADFEMVDTYKVPASNKVLPMALVAFVGELDNRLKPGQLSQWADHAAPGEFREVTLQGVGHGLVQQPPQHLIEELRAEIDRVAVSNTA